MFSHRRKTPAFLAGNLTLARNRGYHRSMPGRAHALLSAIAPPLLLLGVSPVAAAPSKPAVAKPAGAAPGADHRRGKPPLRPSPTLAPTAQTQPEDLGARRGVAGGTPEAYLERATDPELRALRSAEKVLFPELLNGFSPGWSWGRLDPTVQAGAFLRPWKRCRAQGSSRARRRMVG